MFGTYDNYHRAHVSMQTPPLLGMMSVSQNSEEGKSLPPSLSLSLPPSLSLSLACLSVVCYLAVPLIMATLNSNRTL
jgi:hypothetical protein